MFRKTKRSNDYEAKKCQTRNLWNRSFRAGGELKDKRGRFAWIVGGAKDFGFLERYSLGK